MGGGTLRHLETSGKHLVSIWMHLETSARHLGGIRGELGDIQLRCVPLVQTLAGTSYKAIRHKELYTYIQLYIQYMYIYVCMTNT